jgi:hypothetical protein
MKIRGILVDMLIEIDPAKYQDKWIYEGKSKVMYVEVLMALYGLLRSAILFYKKLRKDLESIGFVINPYDPCVANRTVNGRQQTVTWHVDDLKSSHVDSKVNDDFLLWLNEKYGDAEAPVKVVRGKKHDYLGMILDFEEPGVLRVDMRYYIENMIEDFPSNLDEKAKYPWNENLFKVDKDSILLTKEEAEIFHTFLVAKALFLTKRARPDIIAAVGFLCTRVKAPTRNDWFKLQRMMNFLKKTINDVLRLESDGLKIVKWFIDGSFACHGDFRGHTGGGMTLGKGSIQNVSAKQKVNTRSSTETELIGFDDVVPKILWTKLFMDAQGYESKDNIVYRDNQSSMKLEANGKSSSTKRTRHFNIKYFFVTDLIQRGDISIEYCSTHDMWADYHTKPLVGKKFVQFRQDIMNLKLDENK